MELTSQTPIPPTLYVNSPTENTVDTSQITEAVEELKTLKCVVHSRCATLIREHSQCHTGYREVVC